ncbi:MAG: hypothetical protein EOP83_03600 [Verrucomicrobiaceae bacterium]|nr:MAG: hypothetical protein EOP83_03600 [Verrucomicrobiaceae bacterium]
MRILNGMGDIEIAWEPENDAAMVEIIQRKINAGMRFFQVTGTGEGAKRVRVRDTADLAQKKIRVEDEDIEYLFEQGKVQMYRIQGTPDTGKDMPRVDNAAIVAQSSTIGVQPFKGG